MILGIIIYLGIAALFGAFTAITEWQAAPFSLGEWAAIVALSLLWPWVILWIMLELLVMAFWLL